MSYKTPITINTIRNYSENQVNKTMSFVKTHCLIASCIYYTRCVQKVAGIFILIKELLFIHHSHQYYLLQIYRVFQQIATTLSIYRKDFCLHKIRHAVINPLAVTATPLEFLNSTTPCAKVQRSCHKEYLLLVILCICMKLRFEKNKSFLPFFCFNYQIIANTVKIIVLNDFC